MRISPTETATPLSPSPGNPGEGRGEGPDLKVEIRNSKSEISDSHPNPLPAYRERERRGAPLLRAQNLFRVLGTLDNANTILKGVNLSIGHEEYVSIVGASGSGKSTLLYLLGGLDRPTQGARDEDGKEIPFDPPSRVFIDGHDTTELDDQELASLRNEKVGFVFQFHYLLKEFTAQENVALPMFKLGRLKRAAAMERAGELLRKLGLDEKMKRRANRLSGGEQQRVAVARALANEPAVLLADEPTGNLDRANGERVAEVFQELSTQGQTIVMVTHDLTLAGKARRLLRMDDGMIVQDTNNSARESRGVDSPRI